MGALNSAESSQPHRQFSVDENADRHKVYNFEVEGTHTYIADGIRVHNTSILSMLNPGELNNVDWSSVQDTDPNIPGFDYAEIDTYENGLKSG